MLSFATLSTRGQIQRLRQLAQIALAAYAIPAPTLRTLAHGDNTVFLVQGGAERYVLRISAPNDTKPLAVVASELLWLQHLCQTAQLPVPEPVQTQTGKLVDAYHHPGVPTPRLATLFHWIPGRVVGIPATNVTAVLEEIGVLAGQLHQCATQFTPPPTFVRPALFYQDTATFADGLARTARWCAAEDAACIAAAAARATDELRQLSEDPDISGLAHGDLHLWNCVRQRHQIGLIDFDDCGWGHYLYDIAAVLYPLHDHPASDALQAAFLQGYQRIHPDAVLHAPQLALFLTLRQLVFLSWTALRAEDPQFQPIIAPMIQRALPRMRAYAVGAAAGGFI